MNGWPWAPFAPPHEMMARCLALLILAFAALHACYNWAIPLGEGPDEPGHLAYVHFLAAEGRLPVQRAGEAGEVPGEGHQPPLAYALAIPAVAWLPPEERQILLTANPRFRWAGGDEPGAFMRGSRELWPWPSHTLAWHLARAVSGLAGAATVLFTALAAHRLRPGHRAFALLAALLVALNPQLLFITALVTNDALLAALGAALLWWCLAPPGDPAARDWWGGPGRWALVAGLLFGLALLTKQSALLFGPLLLWAGWRVAGGSLGSAVSVTLTWGATSLLVAGWWFLRNLWLYGDPFGLAVFTAEFATQPFAWGDPAAWASALGQLFASFWARFGWMSLAPPAWVLWPYATLCALAVAGWVRVAVASLAACSPTGALADTLPARAATPWVAPLLTVGMAFIWTLSFAATAGLVAWQGRMLFPAVAALGLLLAAGLIGLAPAAQRREAPSTRYERMLLVAGCGMLLALAVAMPLGVIRPGYTRVALAPGVALASLGNPVYARYAASWERGVVLRGWQAGGEARPGATLPLTLTWNSLEPVPRPWTVFVHLVDATGAIVAESNSQPLGGALPFPRWTPGDWMADRHTLPLPPDLPPGSYTLRVGLYRPDKGGERQRVWAEDGGPIGDLVELGAIVVR